ncbi:Nucleoporin nup93 [Chamberlinius hualienensis]
MMNEESGFGDLLDQAEQLTAQLEGGSELPRVERNLRQPCEAGRQSWNKSAQIGGCGVDSNDVKASMLLGSKGLTLPKISNKLESLTATKASGPLEPTAAFLKSVTPVYILNAFKKCGISPFDSNLFNDDKDDSITTDHFCPECDLLEESEPSTEQELSSLSTLLLIENKEVELHDGDGDCDVKGKLVHEVIVITEDHLIRPLPRLAVEEDFVLVKFANKRLKFYYVGKVVENRNDDLEYGVSFLRKVTTNTFYLPIVPDVSAVKEDDVKLILPKPYFSGTTSTQQSFFSFSFDFSLVNIR